MSAFTPAHRGGTGEPLVLLHGFTDSWRTWELVLPALQQHHDVLAPTLTGHAGGPELTAAFGDATLVDGIERAMDEAGLQTAHVVGNSLGGWVALQLAEHGRARSVVALAPAGGWAPGDEGMLEGLAWFRTMQDLVKQAAPYADAVVATPEGRRQATEFGTTNYEHIPAELLAHQIRAAAACAAAPTFLDYAERESWTLNPDAIQCPVRVVWGTADRILPWPHAAVRFRDEWLPGADWVILEGIGHLPQLDVPERTVELVLEFTATAAAAR